MTPKRLLLSTALCVAVGHGTVSAERAKSPADATVFIRLTGSARVEIDELGLKRTAELEKIEVGTGSGFVISPHGYVLTNHHVISNSERVVTEGTTRARITLQVSRIEVCFPEGSAAARAVGTRCVDASVSAADPELDLAVLSISAPSLPYVAFGDSDVVSSGQPVQALGYPLGNDVEVGRAQTASGVVPDISTESGSISALRAGDNGERRYLQVSGNLNPGNSGGPVVDEDGFAVGVIRMRLVGASGIGFAIPINQVKDFLEVRGLDGLMPARRLRLGAFQTLRDKGLGLRVPDAMEDASPLRARVETDARPGDIALRIDRVLTPWTATQVEQSLVGTQQFEFTSGMVARRAEAVRTGSTSRMIGHATGNAVDSGQEIAMRYAVLDLGAEALVARYVGPAELLAFNGAVLRDSLASLDGQDLRGRTPEPIDTLAWAPMPVGDGRVPVPTGWITEPGAPAPCLGLPPARATVAAFAPRDFTMALRVAVWTDDGPAPATAAAACSTRRGTFGAASYATRADWMGTQYVVEGVVTRIDGNVVQAEVVSAEDRAGAARAVLATWLKRATE